VERSSESSTTRTPTDATANAHQDMKHAYWCNTCEEMFEADQPNDATVVCPRAAGKTHDVEYAGPVYFDLDNLDTGDEPQLEIGPPPTLGSPGLVSNPKVSPPTPVAQPGIELGPMVIKKETVTTTTIAPPKPLSFAAMASKPGTGPTVQSPPKTTAPKKVLQELPVASHSPTTLTGKLLEDYEAIMKVVFAESGAETNIAWSSNTGFGPTVHIQTKLKRGDADAERLYRAVRTTLHGKRIPGSKGLTFYVGALCPAMKAGFRISSHKKNNPKGLAILHVDN